MTISTSAFRNAFTALAVSAGVMLASPANGDDYPPFDEVSREYEKVVSTADGSEPLFTVYFHEKKNQLLAELPRNWKREKYFFATTQAAGGTFAGLQGPSRYVYWKQYDKRLALIEPQLRTRSMGELQSKQSVERLFTDRVLVDVPIITMGPHGQPVIDLDDLLVAKASIFVGGAAGGMNGRLARIAGIKAFPQNIEVSVEAPVGSGRLTTFHYSISVIPDNTGYEPRVADERVGYFTTVFRDLGQYDQDRKWVRYIDRWHLEKRDTKLKMSPPKEPVVFYLEHTVPVRYRRWVRQGIEYWNAAFREVGLDDAIEVRYQDSSTGAHMEKDPEDVRYNFIRWLNNDVSTAIGPHRAHPLTGQILDADVVLTDGWIRAYWGWYRDHAPEIAIQSMTPETLRWLEEYPQWDPRILLSAPEKREQILADRAERQRRLAAGEPVEPMPADPALATSEELQGLREWLGDDDRVCLAAHGLAFDMTFSRLHMASLDLVPGDAPADEADLLDGIPEWFVGPLLAQLCAHEVGHTLGLRHNFKASSIYSMEQINSEEWKGMKPLAGSVMDYLPPNFNMETGEIQGDFAMIAVGPYDMWAIEYGYTFEDPGEVLKRVAEPELAYLTDDDTGGPDPLARRYDMTSDPITYAENQMRIVRHHRDGLLEKYVEDGQSWAKARQAYESTLNMQMRMLSMMANWVGGAHVHRDRKGDPNGRTPIEVADVERQRAAVQFVIDNAFSDESFGLTPDLLLHMTVDKWSDQRPGDPTWPVHDRVMAIQASTLTMLLNPSTLIQVYDNEMRTPEGHDALTLPELMNQVIGAVYLEMGTELDGATFTNRSPMISSLRRNLQSSTTDRLVALASGDWSMPRPIRTLSTMHLRRLNEQVSAVLQKRGTGQIDGYTLAHLEDLSDRVEKALNRIYVEGM